MLEESRGCSRQRFGLSVLRGAAQVLGQHELLVGDALRVERGLGERARERLALHVHGLRQSATTRKRVTPDFSRREREVVLRS